MGRFLMPALALACTLLVTDRAECGKPGGGGGGGGSATATFQAINGSGISGSTSLRGQGSSTSIAVRLNGLQPNVEYVATWSSTVACDVGTAPSAGAFMRFRGSKRGTASFTVTVNTPLSNIHSVAIQSGQFLDLLACAELP